MAREHGKALRARAIGRVLLMGIAVLALGAGAVPCGAQTTRPSPSERERLIERRRAFQKAELITAKPYAWIVTPGEAPRVVWRDADGVRDLGWAGELRVRWFDAELKEAALPDHPGRWGAWVEGTAPNGTPLRRSLTFYARPPGFFIYLPPGYTAPMPPQPGPIAAEVWREHREEISKVLGDAALRGLNDSEAGAVLLAGLSEADAAGRRPTSLETAAARDAEFHLRLKLRVQGLDTKVRQLAPPRPLTDRAAPALHEGTAADAGVREDAKAKIDAVCRAWADDSGEPFVALVARRGVIITHEAFGRDASGNPITRDYRGDVASITKSTTAILFSQFVDQGLIGLDDPVSTVFPDYPKDDPRVPTFRQCLTHMSGLQGHGEFGGSKHPHLENILLNAIDVNEPGKAYIYSGMGFDLCAKAMELVTGKTYHRLMHDHLLTRLGLGDVPLDIASSGARFTAFELGALAQWMCNRGSYGGREFISPETFEKMLPEDLSTRYPGVTEVEGIGMHWMKQRRPGAAPDSNRPEDLLFGPRMIGHGSLTACVLLIDLDRELVIVQIRRGAGPKWGDWAPQFFQAIADALDDDGPATAP